MKFPDFNKIEYRSLQQDRDQSFIFAGQKYEHLDCLPGIPPYLRGPYASMYLTSPWTIRQYAGFSTAEESNAFYRSALAAGQKGLSVAFDLATHRGYDSDDPRVFGDVGMAGVAIDSVEDVKTLFEGISLADISVSMTMSGAVLPVLAFYIVAAQEQGVPLRHLSGTIQNDILKEYMVRNTYIYPPEPSMRIAADVIKYIADYMPKYNSVSISGYHMQEAGATADLEMAYALANGLEYVRAGLRKGVVVDSFAPRLSFFWGVGMNFFEEVAKLRASRALWASLMKQFQPKNPKSMALRAHAQTSGWSLTRQDPLNNIIRTSVEALAAVSGQVQSLHTNSFDEAVALPTDFSAKIARDTQLLLQREIGICDVIDPWAGSHYVEKLTHELMQQAWEHIQQVETLGGMVKAIEVGLPQKNIEQAAIKRQAQIDSGEKTIIGVNKYRLAAEHPMSCRQLDNIAIRERQKERLRELRSTRDDAKVQLLLDALTSAAQSEKENLLEVSIEAARARATLGEISFALEKVYGRYHKPMSILSGVYMKTYAKKTELEELQQLADQFAHREGRRPRILVTKLGQDGHDQGLKIIAASFADFGFDVDIGPLFQTPTEVARQAVENDVHVLGISSLAGGHRALIPQLLQELKRMQREDILIIAGGVIPEQDYDYLKMNGVAAIFGPGTAVPTAVKNILEELMTRLN